MYKHGQRPAASLRELSSRNPWDLLASTDAPIVGTSPAGTSPPPVLTEVTETVHDQSLTDGGGAFVAVPARRREKSQQTRANPDNDDDTSVEATATQSRAKPPLQFIESYDDSSDSENDLEVSSRARLKGMRQHKRGENKSFNFKEVAKRNYSVEKRDSQRNELPAPARNPTTRSSKTTRKNSRKGGDVFL
eukprot:gnl/Spiro4/26769_TR13297_c0_g1_i1.p1 gnl/Spiro4/26769_TR13297_c0_g1~~gnl/Spiro4/26769_TR13297_c0_g1_i1.p1  ORF type:complete len:216 (+),score=46.77 gnl/Spiro4/26769_TR13297_c0_g1_i1:78-650(+)